MKKRILISMLIVLSLICICFVKIPNLQAVFDVNLTVRNGEVYVNGEKANNVQKTATFSGAPYVPLNLVAEKIGMKYEKNSDESVVSFSYNGNTLTLDFNKKTALLNGKTYTLLYGTSKKSIVNKAHIFVGNQDIQNIFGIIMDYDESSFIIKINTGFGVVSVDYSQQGGYQSESNMANAKTKLLSYTNNIAASTKSSISIVDKTYVDSLINEVFQSINSPMNSTEFKEGIKVKGLTYKNTKSEDLTYIMNIRFLSSLANITVSPEYVKVYKVANYTSELYVVGMFFAYEGLDISNDDLITAVVATIEDTTKGTLTASNYSKIATKVNTIADSLRNDSKMLVIVINKGGIGAVELL